MRRTILLLAALAAVAAAATGARTALAELFATRAAATSGAATLDPLRRADAWDRHDPEIELQLARAEAEAGLLADAEARLARLRRERETLRADFLAATVAQGLGHPDLALERRLWRLSPSDRSIRALLLRDLAERRGFDELDTVARAAWARDPTDADALVALGLVALERDHDPLAAWRLWGLAARATPEATIVTRAELERRRERLAAGLGLPGAAP